MLISHTSRLLLLLVVVAPCFLELASAQISGTEACSCTPLNYNLTLDFSRGCDPINVDLENGGILDATCFIGGFGNITVQDTTPVSVSSIQYIEIGQDGNPVAQSDTEGDFKDGDTLPAYTSIACDGAAAPRALQLQLMGRNAVGEPLILNAQLSFSNNCGVFPVIYEGDSIGWVVFTELEDPSQLVCPFDRIPYNSTFNDTMVEDESIATPTAGEELCNVPSSGCPVARCAAPPGGCDFIFDHYVLSETGRCCASLCYAVGNDGNTCSFEQNSPETSIGESSTIETVEPTATSTAGGELCDVPSSGCSVARCAAPPGGCDYIFDHYVISETGRCCASLCYAVGNDGNVCSIEQSSPEMSISESTTTETPEPGTICTPVLVRTKQVTNSVGMCPIADCAEAPTGCEYVFDHYVSNMVGNCCPSLCYAVGGDGNECFGDVVRSALTSSSTTSGTSSRVGSTRQFTMYIAVGWLTSQFLGN